MGVLQDRAALPSISTRQAPHAPCPEHPFLGEKIDFSSLNHVKRGRLSLPVKDMGAPFNVNSTITASPRFQYFVENKY
jgi:hypothetical protein